MSVGADGDGVGDTAVRRWQRYGKDRLYVTARDGTQLGWHDLQAGSVHSARPEYARLLQESVDAWRELHGLPALDLARQGALGGRTGGQQSWPEGPARTPEGGSLGSGSTVGANLELAARPPGWGPAMKLAELEEQARVLRAPGDLLAQRRQELRVRDRALRTQAPLRNLLLALVGRRTPERAVLREELRDVRHQLRAHAAETQRPLFTLSAESASWRTGMHGEMAVGRALEQLTAGDPRWRVLHGITVGAANTDIDHLVIGPTGVYTVNSKHHPGSRMFVAHDAVMVNGRRYPYVRNSRHEAARASRLLSGACGRHVRVSGLIVPVGLQRLDVRAQPRDVAVVSWRRVNTWLTSGPAELDGPSISLIYAAACRTSTWRT